MLKKDVPYGKIIETPFSTRPHKMLPRFPVPIPGIVFLTAAPKFLAAFDSYFLRFFHENPAVISHEGFQYAWLRGFETWTDKDGDKLIWDIKEKKAGDSPPGTSPGTAEVFAGTGKYVGMQGTMDWLLRYPKPFPEGTGRGICRENVKLVPLGQGQ
jgi:hypothetical protein